ncbi:MAG: hypothetical protein ACI9HK_002977 [Pirellulaceae bacterium]|jgi:hypothetical protein
MIALRTRVRLLLVAALTIIICGGVSTLPARAQTAAQPSADEMNFGFHVFHSILEGRGLQTTTDISMVNDAPHKSVIVLVGDINRYDFLARVDIEPFLNRGGAVLLATDKPTWVDEFCLIKGGPVTVVDEADAYQGYTDCPAVQDLTSHRINRGITRIIANRAGWIDTTFDRHGSWERIAWFPRSNASENAGETLVATFRSGRSRRGRMVVMSDHSLLINSMIMHGDNSRLLLNLSNWLVEDGRDNLFLVIDGLPQTSNGRPDPNKLPPLPAPEELPPITMNDLKNIPADAWLPFGNKLLAKMEDADMHNELAARRPRQLSDRLYRRALYIAVTVLGLLFILWYLMKRNQSVDSPVVNPAQSGLEARVQQQLKTSQFLPAAQMLASKLFCNLSLSNQHDKWNRDIGEVKIAANWRVRWRVKSSLKRLLAIATQKDGRPLAAGTFRKLARVIREIQVLHEHSQIQWPSHSKQPNAI